MIIHKIPNLFPRFLRTITEKIVSFSWHVYIEIVSHTSRITFEGIDEIRNDRIIGFWHQDCYVVQLILRELQKSDRKVHVIVTKNRRGDYITDMIKKYGAKSLRLPDGMQMRSFMRDLKEESKQQGMILAAAMDGPSGPFHQPKRLLFMLANEADKEFAYARFSNKGMLRLPWRWDHFRVPLPFSRITCKVDYFGKVSHEELRNFDEYAKLHFTDVKEIQNPKNSTKKRITSK